MDFNPAVLTPAVAPVTTTGTLSSSMSITPNTSNAGHIIISAFQGASVIGSGTLLILNFNVVGTPGQSSNLVFNDYTNPSGGFHPGFMFNEGDPVAVPSSGSVTIPGGSTPTNTATNTPTAANTATFTPTPTDTPTATSRHRQQRLLRLRHLRLSNTATNTPSNTATNTPTNTPVFTATSTNTPTNTPVFTATSTNTPTNTPANTATNTATGTATPTAAGTPSGVPVSLPNISATPGLVIIPITVGDLTGLGVISYDMQISFDPTVMTPASPPTDTVGTLSSAMSITRTRPMPDT
ncbi:MAG: hypothetical protein IPL32_00060 [Chloracidobacterium sp.]|nr:hypothetical protein [Chloracidobacterium sp.]